MKKSFLYTVSAVALVGCGAAKDTNWSNDCIKHHSETGREFQQCLGKLKDMKAQKRAAQEAQAETTSAPAATAPAPAPAPAPVAQAREIPPGISIDPRGTDMEIEGTQTGKKTRGGVAVPDEEK